jgi:DsbC/DsbD-like thiol-disulfide interchange protein
MLLLFLLLSFVTPASMQRPSDIVKWSALVPEGPASPGGTVKVAVVAKIEKGWKLYALTQPEGGPQKLAIGVSAGAPFMISPRQIVGPRPKTLDDANFAMRTQYYESSAEFAVPLTLAKTVPVGKQPIPFEITFQACGESLCLRPFTQKLSAEITVVR